MSKTHASSHFDHVLQLLKKRKRMHLVSRDTLQGLVDEMADAARQLAGLERKQAALVFGGRGAGVAKPAIDVQSAEIVNGADEIEASIPDRDAIETRIRAWAQLSPAPMMATLEGVELPPDEEEEDR
jgi:hypothetical protein